MLTKKGFRYTAVTMLKIAGACFVGAFAFYKLTVQARLIPSGFSGIGAFVENITGGGMLFGARVLTAGILGVVLNIPFFIMSYKGMNKRFFWYSVYGMAMWSLMVEIVGRLMPAGVLDITFETMDGDPSLAPLLYAVVAGVAGGVSSGYIVRLGYSTGGGELVGSLVNKRFPSIKVGTVLTAIRWFIIFLYLIWVEGTTAQTVVLSILSGVVSSYTVDTLVDGFKAAKAYYIISNRPSALSSAILDELNRSSTLFSGEGQRLHTEQKMLMCIVYNHEVAKLRQIVHHIDKKAFMFSTMVKEAYGFGFAEQKAPLRFPRLISPKQTPNITRVVTVKKPVGDPLPDLPPAPPQDPPPP